MDLAGYSRTTKTAEVMGPLKEGITERAGMMLAINAPKAAFGIVHVLDDPSAVGACNPISAAHEVLDRTALVKKEPVEVNTSTCGMLILTTKSSTTEYVVVFNSDQFQASTVNSDSAFLAEELSGRKFISLYIGVS